MYATYLLHEMAHHFWSIRKYLYTIAYSISFNVNEEKGSRRPGVKEPDWTIGGSSSAWWRCEMGLICEFYMLGGRLEHGPGIKQGEQALWLHGGNIKETKIVSERMIGMAFNQRARSCLDERRVREGLRGGKRVLRDFWTVPFLDALEMARKETMVARDQGQDSEGSSTSHEAQTGTEQKATQPQKGARCGIQQTRSPSQRRRR